MKNRKDTRLPKKRPLMKRAALAGLVIGTIAVVMRPKKAY
jgi:hypothetical protein